MSDWVPGAKLGVRPPSKEGKITANVDDRKPTSTDGHLNLVERDGSFLWMRYWKLTIGTPKGDDAMDLSELSFTFEVSEQQVASPWIGHFMLYNVGDNILAAMKQMTRIRLDAGYRPPSTQWGLIFDGPINYYRRGRQSATDNFLEIFALANDPMFTQATINTWLPAGHTKNDVVKACVAAFNEHGEVKLGQVPDLGAEKSPRGRTVYGMVADVMRDIVQSAGANWFFDRDKVLHILKEGEALSMSDQSIPVLTSQTGLLEIPVMTSSGGLDLRCLLNPAIKPGTKVKIDNKSLTRSEIVTPGLRVEQERQIEFSKGMLHADGVYTVGVVKHSGESRGNSWYTDIQTISGDPNKNKPPGPPT